MKLPGEEKVLWQAMSHACNVAFDDLRNFHLRVSKTPQEFQLRVTSDIFVQILNHMLGMAPPNTGETAFRAAMQDFVDNLSIMVKGEEFGKYLQSAKEHRVEDPRIIVPRDSGA